MTTFNKPTVDINVDSNVFAIIAHVRSALQRSNQRESAEEFVERALDSKSYDEVIALTFEYVDWENKDYPKEFDDNDDDDDDDDEEYDDDSKPTLDRSKVNGNAYAIIGAVKQALKNNQEHDKVDEFNEKALQSKSYDALLQLTFQYVNWS